MTPHKPIGSICVLLLIVLRIHPSNAYKHGWDRYQNEASPDERKESFRLEEAKRLSATLKDTFWREFKRLTRFDAADRTFNDFVLPRVKFFNVPTQNTYDEEEEEEESVSMAEIDVRLTEWRDRIQDYLERKVDALKNMVRAAERVLTNHSAQIPGFDENCELSYVDARDASNESDFVSNANAIHIPIGVINCSGVVRRDISWLGHDSLTRMFEDNVKENRTILRQYIAATHSAVTRLFPAAPWKLFPPDITVDLFDPRARHWFIRAITCPKDIMFLVDVSGSVAGQTRRLMKLTITTILTTLTPDDYINAVWYHKEVGRVISNCFDGFIPATTRNKMLLEQCLDLLDETLEADFEKALNFTYDELLKWDSIMRLHSDRQYGSGCHKCLFVLTDTVQETGQQLFEKYGFLNDTLEIRLFGFAMGFNTPDIEALQLLSCRRNGGYFKVDSLEDIKEQSMGYLANLSRPLVITARGLPVEERTVSWTGPYMDAQADGPMITLSMPIVNKMKGSLDDGRFAGVAAIDVKLSVLRDLADWALTSEDSFSFAVDNNGNVVFHPDLHIPEVDLQMIRRSACFEATPAKRRSEADKVIFWDTTEEVKMQMGRMDSMYTIDIVQLETSTAELLELRQKMVTGDCTENEHFVSERVQYFRKLRYGRKIGYIYQCRKLPGTPYSLGHAMKQHRGKLSSRVKEGWTYRRRNFTNSSVAWIPSPRIYCKTDLSTVNVEERWIKLASVLQQGIEKCEDSGKTARLMLDYGAVEQWLRSTIWIEDDANQSCISALYSHRDALDLVFVQTEGGLTAFYPKCSLHMPRIFSKDVLQSDYFQYARLWPQSLNFAWASSGSEGMHSLIMFSAVNDQEGQNVLAVIGAQVPAQSVWNWWHFAGGNRSNGDGLSNCWSDYEQRVCYLIDRHFLIIGTSSPFVTPSPGLHLGSVEPYLFEYLANKTTEKTVFTDYQDRCQNGETTMHSSTSDARTSRLLSFIDLIYSFLSGFHGIWSTSFWFNLWSLTSFPLPSHSRLMDCETKRPRDDEQCMRQYEFHLFDPNATFSPDSYYDEACGAYLYFEWTKIERTNLYLIELRLPAHRSECRRNRPIVYSVEPVIRSQCDELKERGKLLPRRRYRSDCVDFHETENTGYNEDTCAGTRHTLGAVFLICSILFTFLTG